MPGDPTPPPPGNCGRRRRGRGTEGQDLPRTDADTLRHPSTGKIEYHKEVEISDYKLPSSCMPDRQGFSDKDIYGLHNCSTSPTIARLPELAHARQRTSIRPRRSRLRCGRGVADPILEASDKAMATFSDSPFSSIHWGVEVTELSTNKQHTHSKRNLLLDLGKDAFFEQAWKIKCVDTVLRAGHVYVTLETIDCENPALTAQE
jgi:hypothetical protein